MKNRIKEILFRLTPKTFRIDNRRKRNININNNDTNFKQELKKYLSHAEIKTMKYDYQPIINILYNRDKIEHKTNKITDNSENTTSEVEQKVLDKLETEITRSNFFNDYSIKILENTQIDHLVDVACKSFVGDTDIPKDPERSYLILKLALSKCRKEEEKNSIMFYLNYLMKTSAKNNNEMSEAIKNIHEDKTNIKPRYITARDSFKLITFYDIANDLRENEKTYIYSKIYECMIEAVREGIYEAYYIIGLMYLNGYYLQINFTQAFYCFTISASYSHSLSYYELYKMLREDKINIYSNDPRGLLLKKTATFDYLHYAAEEGYPEAMHELGNEYMKGTLRKRNRLKALAWHRHACRNGYILSYESCGDLYYLGGDGLNSNKSLSLVMYFSGYSNGIVELKEKVLKLREELVSQGEPIPEMILT